MFAWHPSRCQSRKKGDADVRMMEEEAVAVSSTHRAPRAGSHEVVRLAGQGCPTYARRPFTASELAVSVLQYWTPLLKTSSTASKPVCASSVHVCPVPQGHQLFLDRGIDNVKP